MLCFIAMLTGGENDFFKSAVTSGTSGNGYSVCEGDAVCYLKFQCMCIQIWL